MGLFIVLLSLHVLWLGRPGSISLSTLQNNPRGNSEVEDRETVRKTVRESSWRGSRSLRVITILFPELQVRLQASDPNIYIVININSNSARNISERDQPRHLSSAMRLCSDTFLVIERPPVSRLAVTMIEY